MEKTHCHSIVVAIAVILYWKVVGYALKLVFNKVTVFFSSGVFLLNIEINYAHSSLVLVMSVRQISLSEK